MLRGGDSRFDVVFYSLEVVVTRGCISAVVGKKMIFLLSLRIRIEGVQLFPYPYLERLFDFVAIFYIVGKRAFYLQGYQRYWAYYYVFFRDLRQFEVRYFDLNHIWNPRILKLSL